MNARSIVRYAARETLGLVDMGVASFWPAWTMALDRRGPSFGVKYLAYER